MEFWGYLRPDGAVGVRNHVLILPATRNVNYICHRIALAVPGVTTFYTTGEYGRTGSDRKRLARFLTGIARNPNVANVLLIGMPHGYGYPEFQTDALAAEIETELFQAFNPRKMSREDARELLEKIFA